MKKTTTFLPKFFYAAIFIAVVFGLAVFGTGETKDNNGLWMVDSGWWITNKKPWMVDSGNEITDRGWLIAGNRAESQKNSRIENDGASKLRKIKNLSASVGSGGFDLSSYEVVSTSRDLWSNQSNAQSCVFGSFEYCGRTRQGNESRSQEFLDDSQRIAFRGTGNSGNSQETDIHTEGRLSIGSGGSLSASQTDQQFDQLSSVLDFLQSTIHNLPSTIYNLLSIGVYAVEAEKSPVIPLSLYQPLAGQIMFRKALEKLPVEERTPEKIAELITGISQLLSSFPAKGEIFLSGDKFSGLTGTSGILAGKVVKGTYRIMVDPIEGIDLIIPAAVEAGLHGPETVMIGLTPGKGKIKTTGETGGWKNIFQGLGRKVSRMMGKTVKTEDSQVLGTQVQAETGDALPTAALTIQLFRDSNKNGVYDSGESLVEWAGVKMDLEPMTQSFSYNLTEGWNLIAFPVVPSSVATAAEAVLDIAKEGGYVTTISTWEGDKWLEYSQRGAEKFGHDFALAPGRAYFLESQLNSTWTAAGRPVEADKLIFDLSAGWNGVGILRENMTAVQVLDDLQTIGEVSQTSPCEVCETAEQIAKWNFGLWDVVVKRRYSAEHHEIYGRDFPIKQTEGYFIHANEDINWKN